MKYLRRIVWFFANRLLVFCLILGLIVTVFYYAMNLSNIQIVLKDGMAARAKYIMGMNDSRKDLEKYFQAVCLENDEYLQKTEKEGAQRCPVKLTRRRKNAHRTSTASRCG